MRRRVVLRRDALMLDLNSDLGEGFGDWVMGDDAALLDLVTSANIACGFHAGDPVTMRRLCDLAVARGVRIGAHVGHRDLYGFGRRAIAVEPTTMSAECLYQVGALDAFARAAGDRVRYVKAHGALYHQLATDDDLADALVSAVVAAGAGGEPLALLGPPRSALATAAARVGVAYTVEAFADRAYTPAGGLVPRDTSGAVLDGDRARAQARAIATTGRVRALDGTVLDIGARSLCIHGDSPGAVAMARSIRADLDEHGVEVGAFT